MEPINPEITPELQKVLDTYAKSVGGKTAQSYTNVLDVIQHSPELCHKMNTATQKGLLKSIVLDEQIKVGGYYRAGDKSITLKNADDMRKLAFVLGHEVQHAFNHANGVDEQKKLLHKNMAIQASHTLEKTHDYTQHLKVGVNIARHDEAIAELEGWNTYMSYMKTRQPDIDLQKMAALCPMRDFFFDQSTEGTFSFELKKGLSFVPGSMKFDITDRRNIEAMGKHYFDASGSKIDYEASLIGRIAGLENLYRPEFQGKNKGRDPQIVINMNALGMKETEIEDIKKATLKIPCNHLPYTDSSPSHVHNSTFDGNTRSKEKCNPFQSIKGTGKEHSSLTPLPTDADVTTLFDNFIAALDSNDPNALIEATQHFAHSNITQQLHTDSIATASINTQEQAQALEAEKNQEDLTQVRRSPRL